MIGGIFTHLRTPARATPRLYWCFPLFRNYPAVRSVAPHRLSRRDVLKMGAAMALALPDRDNLLEEIERRACRYFTEHSDPSTGLVRDRARAAGPERRTVASIAATGFGLSALPVADARGYLEPGEARRRALLTLRYLARGAPHNHGFFYHFLDMRSGARALRSELSSVDTAWLLCGALHCRAWFDDSEIRGLATELLDRADWRWMLHGADTLSHGWRPESGFLRHRWDCYAEQLAMYLLAMGSAAHSIPAAGWHAIRRPRRSLGSLSYIDAGTPLFTHQYSHAWVDFRGIRDDYADYFENSRLATLAHRDTCLQSPCYNQEIWGVTAADSPLGYRPEPPEGTVVPCAAGGSLPFAPDECTAALTAMLDRYPKSWGRYGFVDAFDPRNNWYNPDVIGIDLGIMLLMAENARTGAIWRACATDPDLQRGVVSAGLRAAA